MGSTAVGRAFSPASDFVTRNTEALAKDPARAIAGVLTYGGSEALWDKGIDRNVNGQARELKVAGLKAGEAEASANAMIDKQQEEIRQQGLIKERDLARARQRAVMANAGGRSSTILTQPGSYTGASSNGYVPGRKQLLGM